MALSRIPRLCWHRSSCRWYVTVDGHEHYLSPPLAPGVKHPTKRPGKAPGFVTEAYQVIVRRIVELRNSPAAFATPRVFPTVNEVFLAYLKFADTYYVKHGKPTSEIHSIRAACRPVATDWGDEPAADFTPAKLERARAAMVAKGWTRKTVNAHVHRVRAMFRWAVSQAMVPETTWRALLSVRELAKGRTTAPEAGKVRPVTWAAVETTLTLCPEPIPVMVRVQRLVGCRPMEIVAMRPREVNREASDGLWLWQPEIWKTEHHDDGDDALGYWIGPAAQKLLSPLLDAASADDSAWVFPIRYVRGNGRRRGCYTTQSYRRAIERVCEDNELPVWTPNQIRHTRLTEVRRIGGLEAAQAVAQHAEMNTTQIYAERRDDLARSIMREHG